jgi:hypothetical protein
MRIKATQNGSATCPICPKKDAPCLEVEMADTEYLGETPDRYSMTPCDPEFGKQMAIARKGMEKFRDTLHELAK